MSLGYTYAIQGSALMVFSAAKLQERESLAKAFDEIAGKPFLKGDHKLAESGRELEIKRFGQWLVGFWSDHAVKEIRIMLLVKLKK